MFLNKHAMIVISFFLIASCSSLNEVNLDYKNAQVVDVNAEWLLDIEDSVRVSMLIHEDIRRRSVSIFVNHPKIWLQPDEGTFKSRKRVQIIPASGTAMQLVAMIRRSLKFLPKTEAHNASLLAKMLEGAVSTHSHAWRFPW